jgi:hypothetical protein
MHKLAALALLAATVFSGYAAAGVGPAPGQPPREGPASQRPSAEARERREFAAQAGSVEIQQRAERARGCERAARDARLAGDDLRVFMIKCMNTR